MFCCFFTFYTIKEVSSIETVKIRDSEIQEEKNSLTDTCNTDQYGVALLALFVCCVFDQNQDLYNALYSLDEKTQSRVTSAFKYLIGMC